MRSLLSLCLLASSVLLASCGGARPGEPCDETGFLCQDAQTALECQLGTWTELPCRGPGGCTREGGQVSCDMSLNVAGDACATVAEGKGLCSADATALLECRQGELVETMECSSCTVSGEQLTCTP